MERARRPAGHARRAHVVDLVVGLGELRPAERRPRQARRRVRLSLGAQPEPLRRPRRRRAELQAVARRGPDRRFPTASSASRPPASCAPTRSSRWPSSRATASRRSTRSSPGRCCASACPVPGADLLAAEQEVIDRVFAGSRPDYLIALQRRSATRQMALGILEDELRREPHRRAGRGRARQDRAHLGDGRRRGRDRHGNVSPRPPPRPRELPRLRHPRDRRRPARLEAHVPAGTTASRRHRRDRAHGNRQGRRRDARLAGRRRGRPRRLRRLPRHGARRPLRRLTPTLLPYSTYADRAPPADGAPSYYVVRAMDTSGNLSAPSPEATPQPTPTG